jgi:hypothetical protein
MQHRRVNVSCTLSVPTNQTNDARSGVASFLGRQMKGCELLCSSKAWYHIVWSARPLQRLVTSCHVTSRHVTSRLATPRHATMRHVALCCVIDSQGFGGLAAQHGCAGFGRPTRVCRVWSPNTSVRGLVAQHGCAGLCHPTRVCM